MRPSRLSIPATIVVVWLTGCSRPGAGAFAPRSSVGLGSGSAECGSGSAERDRSSGRVGFGNAGAFAATHPSLRVATTGVKPERVRGYRPGRPAPDRAHARRRPRRPLSGPHRLSRPAATWAGPARLRLPAHGHVARARAGRAGRGRAAGADHPGLPLRGTKLAKVRSGPIRRRNFPRARRRGNHARLPAGYSGTRRPPGVGARV